jgi:hypothetical protein
VLSPLVAAPSYGFWAPKPLPERRQQLRVCNRPNNGGSKGVERPSLSCSGEKDPGLARRRTGAKGPCLLRPQVSSALSASGIGEGGALCQHRYAGPLSLTSRAERRRGNCGPAVLAGLRCFCRHRGGGWPSAINSCKSREGDSNPWYAKGAQRFSSSHPSVHSFPKDFGKGPFCTGFATPPFFLVRGPAPFCKQVGLQNEGKNRVGGWPLLLRPPGPPSVLKPPTD